MQRLSRQGVAGGPIRGVRTGAATPMNWVRVLLPELVIQRSPLGSMAMAKGSRRAASRPNPVAGERAAPGVVAEAPASSVMDALTVVEALR